MSTMLSFPWIILETSTSKVHGSHTLMAVKNWLINTTISNIDIFLSLVALYTPTELTMDQPSSYTTWISPYMSTKQPPALRFRCSFWGAQPNRSIRPGRDHASTRTPQGAPGCHRRRLQKPGSWSGWLGVPPWLWDPPIMQWCVLVYVGL